MTTTQEDTKYFEAAAKLGAAAGKAAGSWAIDGNTTAATALAIVEGYDDGDPAIMDMCPSPLSGEFADGPTPTSLAHELGIDPESDDMDDICSHYEDAFYQAYWEEVLKSARVHLPDDADPYYTQEGN